MALWVKMVNFKATGRDWELLRMIQRDIASNATVADALREAINQEAKRRGLKFVSKSEAPTLNFVPAPLFPDPATGQLPTLANGNAVVVPTGPPPCSKCGGVVLVGTANEKGECLHCVAEGQIERSRQKNAELVASGKLKARVAPKKKPVTRPAAPGVNGKTKKAPVEKAAKPGKTGKAAVKKGKVKA